MTLNIDELHTGDEVTWNDPDDGLCTRTLKIQEITIVGDIVQIIDDHGTYLECFKHELS